MVTLSKPIGAGQAQAYHKEEFANAKENYYTEGERVRGEWQGQLAARYGLRGEVNEEQFARLSEGQHPATGRGGTESAGINRHIVGDERALRERRSDSILAP